MPTKPKSPRPSHPEVLIAYLAIGPGRSLGLLRERYEAQGVDIPRNTLKGWSARHRWTAKAEKHDGKAQVKLEDKLAEAQADQAMSTADTFRAIGDQAAAKALQAIRKLNVEGASAQTARHLTEIAVEARRMTELLEGRATNRTEKVTRGKLDRLFEDMQREVTERVANRGKAAGTSVH